MRYFDHDVTANADMKICALRKKYGGAAVDAYWTILEMIYEAEEPLRVGGSYFSTDVIASKLYASSEKVMEWVNGCIAFGLFFVADWIDDGSMLIASERSLANIEEYHAKAEIARQNGAKGGRRKKNPGVSNEKPTGFFEKTDSVSNENQGGNNKRKEKKGVGFDKQNQTPLSVSERALESASDESKTPYCASCGETAIFKPDSMCFVCRNCGTLHGADEVVFR